MHDLIEQFQKKISLGDALMLAVAASYLSFLSHGRVACKLLKTGIFLTGTAQESLSQSAWLHLQLISLKGTANPPGTVGAATEDLRHVCHGINGIA
jgi:hypothetical protein